MKSPIRPEFWLSLSLFMALLGNSIAQGPPGRKPADQPGVKLPALMAAKPLQEDSKDDDLRKLQKARYNAAVGELKAYYEESSLPGVDRYSKPDDLYGPWQRLVQAGLDLCDKPAERVALLTHYLEITKVAEKDTQARLNAGRVSHSDLHRARYQRFDAEIQLLRAKREAEKAK